MKMVSSLWNCLCLLVFILVCPALYAQQTIKGVIKDEQGKLVLAANIILQLNENAPILTFGITGENGEFTLKIPQNLDSVWVMVTHLSYATQKYYIRTSTLYHEIILSPQSYQLPELIVKNDPITRHGDTLTFDVNHYREDSDQNLEQVLSKIPGITVESNGRIKYDGLDISKFYIEGLDMLEGRYRIVTRNLRIDAIRDIEIIEHHQPIRVLDSLIRPDNAAINLRLKSNIALTGSLRGGTGVSPALYLGGADVFGFTKKQQFNILASANNIGENQSNNFQNLYIDFINPETELISVNQVLPPFLIKENYYLDNQELTGGYNYLRKVSEYTELKWQGFARKDRIRNAGIRELRYKDGEEEIIFEEALNAVEQPLDFNNRVIFELNTKKLFFRADANAELNIIETIAGNQVNGILFPENLQKHNFNSFTRLTAIIKQHNKAYQINSDIKFVTTDHDLILRPANIFTPTFPATRFSEALQTARQKKIGINTYSNLFFKTPHSINGQVNLGINYNYTSLNTDILTQSDTTENKSLGQAFQNQNSISEITPYLNQTYRKEKNNTIWTLHIPLSAAFFNLNNRLDHRLNAFHLLLFKPKLEYNLRLAKGNNWNIAYSFQQDYDLFQTLFYEGYIIRSNRNLSTSIFNLNRYNKQELYTRFSGQNLEKGSHLALAATLSEATYYLLNSNVFNQLGLATSVIEGKNKVRSLRFQVDASSAIAHNLNVELQTTYNYSVRPGILNGRKFIMENHFVAIQPKVYYTFTQSILSLKPGFQVFLNRFSENPVYQINTELVYFMKLNAISSFRMSYNQSLTAADKKKVWNKYFTIEYKYTLQKWNADILLNLNNLTNSSHYLTFTQNAFLEDLSYYQLNRGKL